MATKTRKGKKSQTSNKGGRSGKKDFNDTKRVPASDSGDYTADKGMRNCQNGADNDPAWYAQNPQILKDSASFSYNYPLGARLNFGDNPAADKMNSTSLPGIMAIYTTPTFGQSVHANSPINTAARNIYSFVRHANSGHSNYDAPDLMLYLTAMDNLYSFISFLKRAYGVMMPAYYTNRYMPKALIESMHLDYDDLNANLNDFRSFINRLALRVGSMCIPASMSYMARHMWMYEHIWTDDDSDKAQVYLYSPHGFYRYSLDEDSAGQLEYKDLFTDGHPNLTFADLVNYGESMLEPILSSEDMNIMSGDILKAFGSENLYKINMIDEAYLVMPEYSMEVLDQIQNSTLLGHYLGTPTLHQDTTKGYLIFDPVFDPMYQPVPGLFPGLNVMVTDRLVTFPHGDIKPEDTMVATRLTNILDVKQVGPSPSSVRAGEVPEIKCPTMGSEIAHHATIFNYQDDNEGNWTLHASRPIYTSLLFMLDNSTPLNNNDSDSAAAIGQLTVDLGATLSLIGQIGAFDRHPSVGLSGFVNITWMRDSGEKHMANTSEFNSLLVDSSYYTILGRQDLINLAETALLSEFNVLQYGKYGN